MSRNNAAENVTGLYQIKYLFKRFKPMPIIKIGMASFIN